MLENRSFDSIFALSGIPNIIAATGEDSNSYGLQHYNFGGGAPASLTTDPGHEFLDVLEQLTKAKRYSPVQGYPKICNTGFVTNYATSTREGTGLPTPEHYGDVMLGYSIGSGVQLSVIWALASHFAICDQWFSSLPGPTWPNRFFLHGASSSGMDDSPTSEQMGWMETAQGFVYANGSLFDAMTSNALSWRIYNDYYNAYRAEQYDTDAGAIAQVSAIKNISFHSNVNDLSSTYQTGQLDCFISDLNGNYPYKYTFIEPHYGDAYDGTYAYGSSQHPMDDTYGGESLIKGVYEAIRNSPLWERSLLIITYDEHGGLYDSQKPGDAIPPGDGNTSWSTHGFDFSKIGVRVPAVVVSPYVAKGTVSHTPYDHSSVAATLERTFGFAALTERDAAANDFSGLNSLSAARTDCPVVLPTPAAPAARRLPPATDLSDFTPLPESGNLIGILGICLKTDLEMSGDQPAQRALAVEKFRRLKTRGDARRYVREVLARARQRKDALKKP
ncbi:hypothetical protein B1812_09770 [Methylocystis bryophila]|uniref:Phosphoesterase n=2 Tax=Methylocystis bryophila TaxID=655015 RepID=A0A1W6N0Z9_9HYPH|nr:hypothetical protein B1812_09770 [Methylocystis bryophila]